MIATQESQRLPFDRGAVLSGEALAAFGKLGWTLVQGFYDEALLNRLRRWTDDLLAAPPKAGREMVYHEQSLKEPGASLVQRIEDFCRHDPNFERLACHGSLVAAAGKVLGGEACLFKDKINFKLAGGGGFEPHQDQQAGWSTFAPLFVTALVCIDPATVENGCLCISGVPRLTGLIGEEWKPLAEGTHPPLFPVPMEPGDLLLFDSFAPHASGPNRTNSPRRMLYMTYNRREHGDQRRRYFDNKRAAFPPDIEREPGRDYRFRV